MKIRNVSCTQFAGVRDRNVSFTDGINVIFGKNESGKSTLVNLISRTLFQNSRKDGRTDKDKKFTNLYFPAAKKGSPIKGDFVDGKISFETEAGVYTLSKEWGSYSHCTLATPDGIIRDQDAIKGILKEALLYGEGVYSDLLFSSQRNTDSTLDTFLNASKKSDTKTEFIDVISQAFAESDGVSLDAIENEIHHKIDDILGKHWDLDRDAPSRSAKGSERWFKERGEILKAYYALEDAKEELAELSRLEANEDRTANEYAEAVKSADFSQKALDEFQTFAGCLALQKERSKNIDRLTKELNIRYEIIANWPILTENLAKARALLTEKTNRDLLDQYESARKIHDDLLELREKLPPYEPENREIKAVSTAQRQIDSLENRLCGMNLTAAIRMLDGNHIQITSVRTGERVDIQDGFASIQEAVKILIPGVMEMQLSPADVDVASIQQQIAQQQKIMDEIFEKYHVDSILELDSMAKTYTDIKFKMDTANSRLTLLLGSDTYEELEAAAMQIPSTIRSKGEIQGDILTLCNGQDISRYITAKETVVESYEQGYGSLTDLKATTFDLESELRKAKESLTITEDIPAEYLSITDPEVYLKTLRMDLKDKQTLREIASNAKTEAESKLEAFRVNLKGNPAEDVERAERDFQEKRSLLYHWLHIAEVFRAEKEKLRNNPMEDIAQHFARYLGIISGGRVESEFPEADKLNMNIYSDQKLLDYEKLSEGTKETVSLAFRLAVLEHLFPDGGGVIIFDDPFTDMDGDRVEQSCQLLKECAKRHQVIFLTCREDYIDLLNGNLIMV